MKLITRFGMLDSFIYIMNALAKAVWKGFKGFSNLARSLSLVSDRNQTLDQVPVNSALHGRVRPGERPGRGRPHHPCQICTREAMRRRKCSSYFSRFASRRARVNAPNTSAMTCSPARRASRAMQQCCSTRLCWHVRSAPSMSMAILRENCSAWRNAELL